MKYFSTFSGIGGFEKGIQQAYEENNENNSNTTKPKEQPEKCSLSNTGVGTDTAVSDGNRRGSGPTCVGYSEIDKYAIQVYNKQFNHKNYGDITKINAEELPNFDLLVGGFPCQSFSIAGKRGGFEDTRGTMFFELARILRTKQPRLFVFENVKGLLSHDGGRTFATIIQTINELGYDCQWQVLNSKNHGVPQNRERVFIVGHLRGTSRPQVFPFGEGNKQVNNATKIVGNTNNAGCGDRSAVYSDEGIVGALTATDYKQPKQIVQLNQPKHSNDRVYSEEGLSPTLNTMQGGNRQPFIRNPYNGKQSTEETGTLGTSCGTTTGKTAQLLHRDAKIRRLTPKECERLQGFPDDWTKEGIIDGEVVKISDTQRYKMAGNAVSVPVIKAIFDRILSV